MRRQAVVRRRRPRTRDTRNAAPHPKTTIRRIRLELDLTQEEMADRLGIARTTYNEIENARFSRTNGITLNLAKLVAATTGQTIIAVLAEYEGHGAL